MNKANRLIPAAIVIVMSTVSMNLLNGQQLQSWSTFYENGFIYNPALTARWNSSEVSVSHRQSWTGFDDAPEYSMLAFQFPFLRKFGTKVTIGGFIEQDKVGPFVSRTIAGTVAYKITPQLFGEKNDVLTFGLKTGVSRNDYNPDQIIAFDPFELNPIIPNLTSDKAQPTMDVGLFYNSINNKDLRFADNHSHFFFGVAVRDIFPNHRITVPAGQIRSTPHLNVHGGFRKVPSKANYFYEHNFMIDYSLTRAWLAMYNFRFEKLYNYWVSGGVVTNGELFLQSGIILDGRDDQFNWLLTEKGLLRIGAKANYNPLRFGNYAGIGFELYIAYQFNLL